MAESLSRVVQLPNRTVGFFACVSGVSWSFWGPFGELPGPSVPIRDRSVQVHGSSGEFYSSFVEVHGLFVELCEPSVEANG